VLWGHPTWALGREVVPKNGWRLSLAFSQYLVLNHFSCQSFSKCLDQSSHPWSQKTFFSHYHWTGRCTG
jgi:hypothetical protein